MELQFYHYPRRGRAFYRKGDRNAPVALICGTGNRSGTGPGWIKREMPMPPCPVC